MPAATRLPTPADEPILRALARLYYLTAAQICQLLYSYPSSLTYARARLKALVDAKLVQRLEMPHPKRTGSAPNVFRLANHGYRFLEELGLHPMRLPDERPASYLYYLHTLKLNDALVSAELLIRSYPELSLQRLVHERELKRLPVKVQLPTGTTVSVIPDAYVQIYKDEPSGPGWWYDLVVELDMGTAEQRDFRQKVAALVSYGLGPYREVMGAASITIAVLTPNGAKRASELLAWIEAELVDLGQQVLGEWFCVRGVDPAAVSPQELFLAPSWRQPFGQELVPLIELGREAS